MALANSRRKRARTISYREASTSSDEREEDNDSPREQNNGRNTRRRVGPYVSVPSRAPQSSSRPLRSTRQSKRISYTEPGSDIEPRNDDSDEEEQEPPRPPPRQSSRRKAQAPAVKTKALPTKSSSGTRRRRKQSQSPKKSKAKALVPTIDMVTDGHIPSWAWLPYHILLQIFTYASYPLYDANFAATPSINWLLQIALMCRPFSEPAITALYRSLPVMALDKLRRSKLLALLAESPDDHLYNYNVKVKSLEFGYDTHIASTIVGMIPHLPNLSELDIYHPQDLRFSQRGHVGHRWHYPDDLFRALDTRKVRLKSWSWNASLCNPYQSLFWIQDIHTQSSFSGIQHLSLMNFHADDESQDLESEAEAKPTTYELLGTCLSALPNLKSLQFSTCGVVNSRLLPLLPDNLVSLQITDCLQLDATSLDSFLVTHGRNLKELVLNHNQALDISFLPNLRYTCPRLEVLRMDLNFFGSQATHGDSKPAFVNLLAQEEVPTWPSTLKVIDMVHLRKWTAEVAEIFFKSLVDSAEELPHLRVLIVKAILDISWRERATIRDRWFHRLKKVFWRKTQPPSTHLVSLRAYREWKESESAGPDTKVELIGFANNRMTIAVRSGANSTEQGVIDNVESPASETWSGRRLRTRKAPNESRRSSLGDFSDESQSSQASDQPADLFIQGMCHEVDIRIDNLRPTEDQFDENDFLDTEASGDDDWTGDDNIPEVESYAW